MSLVWRDETGKGWREKAIFVVGKATAKAGKLLQKVIVVFVVYFPKEWLQAFVTIASALLPQSLCVLPVVDYIIIQ